MLMGEDDAKVNFVAGSEAEEGFEAGDEREVECEYKWEYEDGGLWVGTVGAVEMLEWGKEASDTTGVPASVLSGSRPEEEGSSEQNEQESDFQVDGDLEEEATEDEWWGLEAECSGLEDAEVGTLRIEPPHRPPRGTSQSSHSAAAGKRGTRKKQETAADQLWEEARQKARLRQMLSSGFSSEDEDEEQHGGWVLEFYEPP
jgi:hypothetical protein